MAATRKTKPPEKEKVTYPTYPETKIKKAEHRFICSAFVAKIKGLLFYFEFVFVSFFFGQILALATQDKAFSGFLIYKRFTAE